MPAAAGAVSWLILDDITLLKMHREADQDVLDLILSLMSMSVTLILVGVGIRQSGLLRGGHPDPRTGQWAFPPGADDAQTQTERRFDLADLGPFRHDTPADIEARVRHLAGIEDQLRLLRAEPGMLTSGDMPEYLFRRTSGVVGLLERLIEDTVPPARTGPEGDRGRHRAHPLRRGTCQSCRKLWREPRGHHRQRHRGPQRTVVIGKRQTLPASTPLGRKSLCAGLRSR